LSGCILSINLAKISLSERSKVKDRFNHIIDVLEIKYVLASKRSVITPVELARTLEQKDILIQVNSGHFYAGDPFKRIEPGNFYLIPRDSVINFRHGVGPYEVIGSEGFTSPEQRERYLKPIAPNTPISENEDVFTILGFEVLIHGAIPFLSMLEIPAMDMGRNPEMEELTHKIMNEVYGDELGKTTLIKKYTEELLIQVCRYIFKENKLHESILKLDYVLDKRLINIIQFIQDNLDKDLSNSNIARLAYVSKDYIGQFFKSMTNHNLQDYIESRRLEHAHFLLRSSSDSIQEISQKVGFTDAAYFSRRFKIRFKQNAREVRRSDILSL
jgi:AraC family transcriptional activator of mtrCDE